MKLKHLFENVNNTGLYVGVKFSENTLNKIQKFCKEHKIPNALKKKDFHCTIAYSRKPVPNFKPIKTVKETGKPIKFEIWESPPNVYKDKTTYCLIVKIDSEYLHVRFNNIIDMGATYDYDEYKPHLTLSYDVGKDFDIKTLRSIDDLGQFEIITEYSEKLDLGKTF